MQLARSPVGLTSGRGLRPVGRCVAYVTLVLEAGAGTTRMVAAIVAGRREYERVSPCEFALSKEDFTRRVDVEGSLHDQAPKQILRQARIKL